MATSAGIWYRVLGTELPLGRLGWPWSAGDGIYPGAEDTSVALILAPVSNSWLMVYCDTTPYFEEVSFLRRSIRNGGFVAS